MGRDLTKYSFRGSKELHKNYLLKEVVAYYLENNPNSTWLTLKNVFPEKSDFSVDMLVSEQEYSSFNEG